MERDSYNENFEQFVRHHADNLRMKPSKDTWQSLSGVLNKRRKNIRYGLTGFFLLVAGLSYYFISNSIKQIPVMAATEVSAVSTPIPDESRLTVVPADDAPIKDITDAANSNTSKNKISNGNGQQAPVINMQAYPQSGIREDLVVEANKNLNSSQDENVSGANSLVVPSDIETVENAATTPISVQSDEAETPNVGLIDAYADLDLEKAGKYSPSSPRILPTAQYPLSIESVVNSYRPVSLKKLQWQLSVTPTVSYRKLGENRSYMRDVSLVNAPATIAPLYSVNSAVTHKPNMGFEVGLNTKYPISKKIKLTGGLQFNVSRYDIKAFNAPYSVATIRLNNGTRLDSVHTVSNYSNTAGYRSSWLENLYFQISAPIGVEFQLAGKDKTQFGIATSVQPTYVIGDRAYVITSDYKSYAEVPWLIRRWNVNTAVNAFVSYKTGNTRWQVGPQVRYQLLSSFISQYPVKENLIDFGFRIGVSLNNK